jgi:hypothetical protein
MCCRNCLVLLDTIVNKSGIRLWVFVPIAYSYLITNYSNILPQKVPSQNEFSHKHLPPRHFKLVPYPHSSSFEHSSLYFDPNSYRFNFKINLNGFQTEANIFLTTLMSVLVPKLILITNASCFFVFINCTSKRIHAIFIWWTCFIYFPFRFLIFFFGKCFPQLKFK